MRKHYDCLFSLGAACASSQALRFANMQFASYPFDWVGGSDIVTRAKLVANGFVSLAANPWMIVRYLRENACTTDLRTEGEKRRFAEIDARRDEVRYAGRGLTLWINKRAYRLYRRIERFLVERGVLPRILRPPKLYDDKSERQTWLRA